MKRRIDSTVDPGIAGKDATAFDDILWLGLSRFARSFIEDMLGTVSCAAAVSGIPERTLRRLINGERIKVESLERIAANLFEASIAWVLEKAQLEVEHMTLRSAGTLLQQCNAVPTPTRFQVQPPQAPEDDVWDFLN